MWLNGLLLLVALIALFLGAEGLVKGASSIARRLGLTPLVIGLTVVAFGTSLPELVVSLLASIAGTGDIAMGNVVGSNIFNLGVILGLTALIRPIAVQSAVIRADAPVMMVASVLLVALMYFASGVPRTVGFVFTAILIVYTGWNIRLARRETASIPLEIDPEVSSTSRSLLRDGALVIGGLLILTVGSRLLVYSASEIARGLGLSEAIIALTIVAAGTSMPELATSLLAAVRRQGDLAIGNLIGSNIFNIFGILGIVGAIAPISAPGITPLDLGSMLAFALLLFPLLWTGRTLHRWEGALLLLGYGAYLWAIWP